MVRAHTHTIQRKTDYPLVRTHTFAFLAPYLMVIISVVVLAAIVVLVVVSFVILKRGEIYQKNWGVGSAGISIG